MPPTPFLSPTPLWSPYKISLRRHLQLRMTECTIASIPLLCLVETVIAHSTRRSLEQSQGRKSGVDAVNLLPNTIFRRVHEPAMDPKWNGLMRHTQRRTCHNHCKMPPIPSRWRRNCGSYCVESQGPKCCTSRRSRGRARLSFWICAWAKRPMTSA